MKTVTGCSQWFVIECARCAKAGWTRAMAGDLPALYLYFKRGSLVLAEEQPEGYELGYQARMPLNLTQEQLTGWVHTHSTRLACLPGDD